MSYKHAPESSSVMMILSSYPQKNMSLLLNTHPRKNHNLFDMAPIPILLVALASSFQCPQTVFTTVPDTCVNPSSFAPPALGPVNGINVSAPTSCCNTCAFHNDCFALTKFNQGGLQSVRLIIFLFNRLDRFGLRAPLRKKQQR